MIFDTDILIWCQRGHMGAAELMNQEDDLMISTQTYLELLQSAVSKKQHIHTLDFLRDYHFITLPFTPAISHRASIYIEAYALSHGLKAGDAIIGATAAEHNLTLATGNTKHFRCIPGLKLYTFKP
jgi:predicted nucleic acid-binding protein